MKSKFFNCVFKIIIVLIKYKYFLFFFLVDIFVVDKNYRCVFRGRNFNVVVISYRY